MYERILSHIRVLAAAVLRSSGDYNGSGQQGFLGDTAGMHGRKKRSVQRAASVVARRLAERVRASFPLPRAMMLGNRPSRM